MHARESDPGVVVWEAMLRVHAAVLAVLSAEVEEVTGLALSSYDVLLELNRAPDRELRMTELGERVVLSRSRVSRVVDSMESQGLVVRRPDPADGRATLVTATPAGRSALRRAAPTYLQGIRRHFSAYLTRDESNAMREALNRILDHHTASDGKV